jgi:hypothetical protein
MKRRQFLNEFLGAFGAENIEWHEENDNYISGKVIYNKNDPEETQEFCWHMSEQKAPNMHALGLTKLLNEKELLSIDGISITREELRLLYNERSGSNTSDSEFSELLEELEAIQVPMVDDGNETDAYFIHE